MASRDHTWRSLCIAQFLHSSNKNLEHLGKAMWRIWISGNFWIYGVASFLFFLWHGLLCNTIRYHQCRLSVLCDIGWYCRVNIIWVLQNHLRCSICWYTIGNQLIFEIHVLWFMHDKCILFLRHFIFENDCLYSLQEIAIPFGYAIEYYWWHGVSIMGVSHGKFDRMLWSDGKTSKLVGFMLSLILQEGVTLISLTFN